MNIRLARLNDEFSEDGRFRTNPIDRSSLQVLSGVSSTEDLITVVNLVTARILRILY